MIFDRARAPRTAIDRNLDNVTLCHKSICPYGDAADTTATAEAGNVDVESNQIPLVKCQWLCVTA